MHLPEELLDSFDADICSKLYTEFLDNASGTVQTKENGQLKCFSAQKVNDAQGLYRFLHGVDFDVSGYDQVQHPHIHLLHGDASAKRDEDGNIEIIHEDETA